MTGAEAGPSAREWLRRLRERECSARELVERCIARIDSVEPQLGAVVALDAERALRAADEADAERASGSERPLLGLPLTIKDALDVAGYATTGGSVARAAALAERDATAVARLREAGAVVLAKTNLPEASAGYETDNALFGRTQHPLDPAPTPGGSSGGEAALLGADASIAGVGTDGGGSIRVPAHYCGVVGLRPTVGRVPETGCWPPTRATGMMDMSCVGPMARHVEDLGLLLDVLAGPDGVDPYAVPVPLGDWRALEVAGLRVGFYDHDPALPDTTAGTRAAVRRAAAALEHAGCRVAEAEPPDGPEATRLFFSATGANGRAALRRAVEGAHGRHHPRFLALLRAAEGRAQTAASFFDVQRRLFDYRCRVRALLQSCDALLCPVVAGPAPPHGEPPAGLPAAEYDRYEAFHAVHVFAAAGAPAVSVPVHSEGGLPVGVQVAARPYREDVVLAVAAVLEDAFGGFRLNRQLDAAGAG